MAQLSLGTKASERHEVASHYSDYWKRRSEIALVERTALFRHADDSVPAKLHLCLRGLQERSPFARSSSTECSCRSSFKPPKSYRRLHRIRRGGK